MYRNKEMIENVAIFFLRKTNSFEKSSTQNLPFPTIKDDYGILRYSIFSTVFEQTNKQTLTKTLPTCCSFG